MAFYTHAPMRLPYADRALYHTGFGGSGGGFGAPPQRQAYGVESPAAAAYPDYGARSARAFPYHTGFGDGPDHYSAYRDQPRGGRGGRGDGGGGGQRRSEGRKQLSKKATWPRSRHGGARPKRVSVNMRYYDSPLLLMRENGKLGLRLDEPSIVAWHALQATHQILKDEKLLLTGQVEYSTAYRADLESVSVHAPTSAALTPTRKYLVFVLVPPRWGQERLQPGFLEEACERRRVKDGKPVKWDTRRPKPGSEWWRERKGEHLEAAKDGRVKFNNDPEMHEYDEVVAAEEAALDEEEVRLGLRGQGHSAFDRPIFGPAWQSTQMWGHGGGMAGLPHAVPAAPWAATGMTGW